MASARCCRARFISYDLVQSGCEPTAQTVIRRLMRRRGRIMWGAIDPQVVDAPHRVVDRVRAAVRAVAGRQWTTQDVLSASLLSASSGTGGVSVVAERRVARSIQSVAGLLRGAPEMASALEVPEPTPAGLALEPIGGLRGENRARPGRECTIAAESVKLASATKGTRSESGTDAQRWRRRAGARPLGQAKAREGAREVDPESENLPAQIRHHGFATRADASMGRLCPFTT